MREQHVALPNRCLDSASMYHHERLFEVAWMIAGLRTHIHVPQRDDAGRARQPTGRAVDREDITGHDRAQR